jgi:hypothetical protein
MNQPAQRFGKVLQGHGAGGKDRIVVHRGRLVSASSAPHTPIKAIRTGGSATAIPGSSRVKAGIDRARANGVHIGRKPTPAKVEAAIREKLAAGVGMLKVAAQCHVGSGTVQRIKREMMAEAAT